MYYLLGGLQRLAFTLKNESQTYSQLGIVFNNVKFMLIQIHNYNILIHNTLKKVKLQKI